MRVKYSLLNIGASLCNQLLIVLLSFVTRTVFIQTLGYEYLGVNALFASVLSMLALLEAGVGASIIFQLYKPAASGDEAGMLALLHVYKRLYRLIFIAILVIGLGVYPIIHLLVADVDIPGLPLIYSLFVLNSAAPYLFMYKQSLVQVLQKGYIVTSTYAVSSVIIMLGKIAILKMTGNYLLYLLLECTLAIVTASLLSAWISRRYPMLKNKSIPPLSQEARVLFRTNMKAILLQNIGLYFVFGIDSLLITAFVGVVAAGVFANYKLLFEITRTLLVQVFNGVCHSVGHLTATENSAHLYRIYRVLQLGCFWLYSTAAILLVLFADEFIRLWLGEEAILPISIPILLAVVFLERGMRSVISTVKATSGVYHPDRFDPLCQAVLNIALALLLVDAFGVSGVLAALLISALAVPFWRIPTITYRTVFQLPLWSYFRSYLLYLLSALVAGGSTWLLLISWRLGSWSIGWGGVWMTLVIQALASLAVINAVYLICFGKTAEFRYLVEVAGRLLSKLRDWLRAYVRTAAQNRGGNQG